MKKKHLILSILLIIFCHSISVGQINLTKGLIAYYPFSGNANDLSGNNINGTTSSVTLTTDMSGVANSAYSFNGTNSFISLPFSSLYDFAPTDSFSLSVWVLPDVNMNWAAEALVVKSPFNSNYQFSKWNYGLYMINNVAMTGWANNNIVNGTTPMNNNQCWYNEVVTYKNGEWHLYLNGIQEAQDLSKTHFIIQDGSSSSITFGKKGLADGDFFKGKMDEVRIYNRPLSAAEVKALYIHNSTSTNNDTTICAGNSLPLIASGAISYSWLPTVGLSNPNIPNPIATPSSTTQYIVTGTSINGCISKDTVIISVNTSCNVLASFTAPDTICVNSPVSIANNSIGASSNYWSFCSANLNQTPQAFNLGSLGNKISMPVFIDYVLVNGNYYGFLIDYYPGELLRLDFGNSLLNTPTATSLGNFSGIIPPSGTGPEGIQIIQNQGKWYLFIVGDGIASGDPRLIMIDFGSTITNNTPTATNWGDIGNMSQPVDLFMFNDNNSWYGFTVNSLNNTITRFNFGTNFNISPTGNNLGNIGNLNYPTGVYALKDNGNWRVFVCNGADYNTGANATITRLDFGTSLLNNPVGVNLGNPGGLLHEPRDFTLMQSCNQLIGFAVNGYTNDIVKFDFNNNASSIPSAISLGNIGSLNFPHSISKLFRVGSDIYGFVPNVNANTITRLKFPGCNNSSIQNSNLQNPPSFSYRTPGTYNVNLTVDEGLPTQSTFCKQIVVVPSPTLNVTTNSSICLGTSIQLNASGATSYSWTPTNNLNFSTISNPVASPTATTKYYVTGKSYGCSSTDSLTITVNNCNTGLIYNNDTTICPGKSVNLSSYVANAISYQWSPSIGLSSSTISNPVATPTTTTTYSVYSFVPQKNNLIVNGDFSAGNTGFSSTYTNVTGYNSLYPEATYAISLDPNNEHMNAYSFPDHTTGTGYMMAINGSSTPSDFWCQTINVTPNTHYIFSAWFANWSPDTVNDLPAIQFKINGILLGNLNNFPPSKARWVQFYTTWYSGANTSINLCINDQQTALSGNDFTMDDVFFAKLDSLSDSVKINVLPPPYTKKDSSFGCNAVTYKGINYTSNTIVTDTIRNRNGCDSIYHDKSIIIYPKPFNVVDSITNCNSIIYNGITYLNNTIVMDTIKSIAGCDSIVRIHNLIIKKSNPLFVLMPEIKGCINVLFNGTNYSSSTILKDTIKAYLGCDSIIHLQNIIVYPAAVVKEDTLSGCGTVTYKGTAYNTSTILSNITPNNFGCDSIIFKHHIIVYPQSPVSINASPVTGCKKVVYNGITYNTSATILDTVKSIHGCDSIYRSTAINVFPSPTLFVKDTTICYGDYATLNAVSNGTIKWLGYTSGVNPLVVNPSNDNDYYATATSPNGCNDTMKATVVVEHLQITLNASSNPVNKGLQYTLQATANLPYKNITWTTDPINLQVVPNAVLQTIMADTTTMFSIKAFTANGCTDTASVNVLVMPTPVDVIIIPNAFSPNGDGIHDVWIIKGISNFRNSSIIVYDRNGQIVYNGIGVSDFNGRYHGNVVPDGTYYYIIKLNDPRFPFTYTGWLEIIR